MRFDTTLYYHVGSPYAWETLFEEMRETVELVDELGFTGVWLAEHHFAWDGWYRSAPNPILLGADVARYSERLRIGQCGVVLPDWHPLRVAEDIALLDQMTKGRVDFGIAPGINSRACRQFHPAADRRDREANGALYAECLDVILTALTEEAFSHQGRHFTFPAPGWKEANPLVHDARYHAPDGELERIGIFPRPYQRPHPPIYQMSESLAAAELCARKGIRTMSQAASPGRLRENWTRYREVATQSLGRPVAFGEGLAVMRTAFLAESQAEAESATRPGVNQLGAWGSGSSHRLREAMATGAELEAGDLDLEWFDFQLKHDSLLIGTPDRVAGQIERLREQTACDHLALFLNIPGLGFEQVKRSLRLFATEVMPRFA